MADLDAAEQFLAAHARVLERRAFAAAFRGGPARAVRDAVAAYRNDDGGFGHALEPDGRGPGSQPIACLVAFDELDHADAWDEDLVLRACDWLQTVAPAEGGATFALPDVEGWPHAPWWQPADGLPPARTTTGQVVAPLLRRGIEHPWLDGAVEWLWSQAEHPGEPQPGPGAGYEARGLVAFLDAVPDEQRAAEALDGLRGYVEQVVKRDPDDPAEQQSPLDLAPRPDGRARRLFDAAHVDAFLDALDGGQREDGGWEITWPHWSPAAVADSRGMVTLGAARTLRANGRV